MPAPRSLLAALRLPPFGDDASDCELLGRFADYQDEAAFDTLVRRHARLVWGVCRRTLGPGPDAEDAFQATFLVLARRPDRARQFGTAAGFLFGVARRASLKAKSRANRPDPQPVPRVPPADPAATAALREIQTILDDEIGRLPDKYRLPFVLCVLEGKPRAKAAAELGLNPGTLSARLARARLRLRDRLAGRGVSLAAALAATDLAANAVPPGLTLTTIGLATRTGPAVTANVLYLASEGWWAMKAKLLLMASVLAGVGGAVGLASGQAELPKPADPPKPAAEAKAAEPEAKPVPQKARLTKKYELIGRTGQPVWSPDGKRVAVPQQGGVLIVRPGGDDKPVPLGRHTKFVDPPTQPGDLLGFSPDGNTLLTRLGAGGLVNAENRILFWNSTAASTNPKEATLYDPDDGEPFAVFPDGKRAFARSSSGLVELDLATGQPGRVVLATPPLGEWAFTPDLRYAVCFNEQLSGEDVIADITVWDLASGKLRWRREVKNFQGVGRRTQLIPPAISHEGNRVAVTLQYSLFVKSSGGVRSVGAHPVQSLLVLDGETGRDVAAMTAPSGQDGLELPIQGVALSHDGRLLAGVVQRWGNNDRSNPGHLAIWDAATGKLLKKWPGFAQVAFAPDRPVLATAESRSAGTDANGRPAYTSSLGLWDLSGLGK